MLPVGTWPNVIELQVKLSGNNKCSVTRLIVIAMSLFTFLTTSFLTQQFTLVISNI